MTRGRLVVLAALVVLAVVFAPSATLAPPAPDVAGGVTAAVLAPTHDAADTGRATSAGRTDLGTHLVGLTALAVVVAGPPLGRRSPAAGHRGPVARRPPWARDLAGRAPPVPSW